MPKKLGNEIRLPGTTGIDNLPNPLNEKVEFNRLMAEIKFPRHSRDTELFWYSGFRFRSNKGCVLR